VQSFPEWQRGRDFSVVVTMDGKPFAGMHVVLEPEDDSENSDRVETRSDQDGIAEFMSVKPGRYDVEAARLGVVVHPGTVVVNKHGSSERIELEWPLRNKYEVMTLSGRLQRHLFRSSNPIEGYVHPEIRPLSGARLTLSRVDSQEEKANIVTDSDGDFSFPTLEPGYYLLHIAERLSSEFAYPIDDYLLIEVDPASSKGNLNLQLAWSSCGMSSSEAQSTATGRLTPPAPALDSTPDFTQIPTTRIVWEPPDWSFPQNVKGDGQREMLSSFRVSSYEIILEGTAMKDVQKRLGGQIGSRGSDASKWLCFHGENEMGRWVLWLENDEISEGLVGSFQWWRLSENEVLDPRCQVLGRDSMITLPVPLLTLGATQSQVLKSLGSPTAIDSQRLIYLHAHDNGSFVSSNGVIVRLQNGVVWAIQASKTTSD